MAFSVKSTRWGHNVTKHWSSTCALLPNGCNGSNLTEVCHQDLLNEDQIMLVSFTNPLAAGSEAGNLSNI